ncbi:hypothetical protein D3C83_26190 [compost metagenome]
MMGAGTPFGATTPHEFSITYPGTPDSATVGMSGTSEVRFAPVTASARSLPDRACGSAIGMSEKTMCIRPPITSLTANIVPLYGMWTMLTPASFFNSSPPM